MKKLFVLLLMLSLVSFTAFSKTYVLVPGALEDATAWYKIKTALEKQKNKVVVVNRLIYGKSNPNVGDATLNNYIIQIVDSINAQKEKVILVGHSFGGVLISEVAERIPEKISYLVYIAAIIPQTNQSASDFLSQDKSSKIAEFFNVSNDKSYGWINQNHIKDILCTDCSQEDVALYKLSITDKYEPLGPFSTTTSVGENFNNIPKVIIQTTLDQVITYGYQQQYAKTTKNVKNVYQINSSHMPNLSMSKELSEILVQIK